MKSSWFTLRHTVEGVFWKGTAAAAGFAAHHRRHMRLIPVAAIAASAFFLGRAAGGFLLPLR